MVWPERNHGYSSCVRYIRADSCNSACLAIVITNISDGEWDKIFI